MAKQCRVVRGNDGQIQSVKTEQGNDSTLFNSLNNIIKEPNTSLEYYAISETEDFKEVISQPSPKKLFEFNNSFEKSPLNSQEIVELQNSILSTNVSNSTELYENMYNALVNRNGIITFNEDKLKTVYNSFEIARIMSSPDLQQTIKQAFLKLKNTPEISLDYNTLFVLPASTSLNIFGKQVNTNPFILEKEIDRAVAGVGLENITESLTPNAVDKYITDNGFREVINEKKATLRTVPLMTVLNGELTQKEDNIANYLPLTIINEANEELSQDIEFLNLITSQRWQENREDVQEILENIVESVKANGIDLRDFAIRTSNMTREEVLSFLSSMEDTLENPTEENQASFVNSYNSVLKATTLLEDTIVSQNEFETSIDTDLSEYEMLRDFNMIKKSDGVYRKVTEQSLEELYSNFFQNNNQGFTTVEDLIKSVQEKGIQQLNITDYQVDNDILEKMYLYKTHFGFPLNIAPAQIKTDNLHKVTLNENYLTDDFVREFNRFALQTENDYFTVNEKGIQISSNDTITTTEALTNLPVDLLDQLAQYNLVSKNLNLDLQPQEPIFTNINSKLTKRQEAVNNPELVTKLSGEYTYIEDGVLAVKNENEDFVRTPNGIYEMVYEQGNIKFYGQLPQANPNYILANIQSPLSNVDYNNYLYLEDRPDLFKQAKNYYTKKELEQINQENFNCQ